MQVIDIQLSQLHPAYWNPNRMEDAMVNRLKKSITRFGLVQSPVVRPIESGGYEVLGGNQRLQVLRELGYAKALCVLVEVDDNEARLMAQALNRIQGEDDMGLKAELVREILESMPEEEVLDLLPETSESLQWLSSVGQQEMAEYLQNWQQAQVAKLQHLQFQLLPYQLEVVEEALSRLFSQAKKDRGPNPNIRGTALFLMCQHFLTEETP